MGAFDELDGPAFIDHPEDSALAQRLGLARAQLGRLQAALRQVEQRALEEQRRRERTARRGAEAARSGWGWAAQSGSGSGGGGGGGLAPAQARLLANRMAGALWGIFIGDALAMPAHWYYDVEALRQDYGRITGYTAPHTRVSPPRYQKLFRHAFLGGRAYAALSQSISLFSSRAIERPGCQRRRGGRR